MCVYRPSWEAINLEKSKAVKILRLWDQTVEFIGSKLFSCMTWGQIATASLDFFIYKIVVISKV